MSLKLKALGLSLIAAMAVSAVAVMNASATAGGHFVSTGNSHAHVKGFVDKAGAGPHTLHLFSHPKGAEGEEIGCDEQSYTATTTTETTETITVTPTYGNCYTTESPGTIIPITMNGCTYTFTTAPIATPEVKTGENNVEQTAHLVCPPGNKVEIHHQNCTVSIHPQTPTGTLTYTTETNAQGTHEITMDVEVTFLSTTHGLCQFVKPTNSSGTLTGSVTVKGFDTLGNQTPITAT